ncbi:MAG: hypothetical protein P4L76_07255 [Beijerinckiaceae bacterium]|nr:hypothetical protein [Beijerinckiaceae bacterium]
MTDDERIEIIKALGAKYLEKNTVSREAAHRALVRQGIYTSKGTLSPHYGGEKPVRAKRVAKAVANAVSKAKA